MKGLILIYAITAFGCVGALRQPLIGLFIYIGFAILRPQFIWGFAGDFTGISQYVGIATLIGWVLHGCGSFKFGRGRSIVIALVGFTVWFAIATTQAVDKEVAQAELMPFLKIVMPFLIGATLIDTKERSRALLWTIVLAQGYVALEMNQFYLFKGYNAAADGFGGMDNNCFGVALVTTIGPAIVLGVGAQNWKERALAGIAAALILHATLLTFSRGAMVGLLATGATAFLIMPKRPKQLAALLAVALIAARLTGPQLAARYASTMADSEERDGSAESRIDLWADCWKVAVGKPFFGTGPGNFKVIAESLGWTPGKQAHSTWMQTMAETGFPGIAALFLFFTIPIVKLWPLARAKPTPENRHEAVVASGIIISIVGFAVSAQFVSLAGLEIPYYVAMIGVVLLKSQAVAAPAPAPARTFRPTGPAQRGPFRPVAAGPGRD
jgi:probable O-glycosylation ligase (exosortase A-associated)